MEDLKLLQFQQNLPELDISDDEPIEIFQDSPNKEIKINYDPVRNLVTFYLETYTTQAIEMFKQVYEQIKKNRLCEKKCLKCHQCRTYDEVFKIIIDNKIYIPNQFLFYKKISEAGMWSTIMYAIQNGMIKEITPVQIHLYK